MPGTFGSTDRGPGPSALARIRLGALVASAVAVAPINKAPIIIAHLAPAPDRAIWAHARDNGFVIVSKDEDFHRLSVLHGPPPKVIWIRRGNVSTAQVEAVLRGFGEAIERLDADPELTTLVV